MLSLQHRNWQEFILSDMFNIVSTSSSIDKNRLNGNNGIIPYITRSETNNGIDDFVCCQDKYSIDSKNCITIGLDTQSAFYQSYQFYTGQNIQILYNNHLNPFNAKFVLPLLRNLMSVFSWGSHGATLTRLRRSIILLPSNKNNSPDWQFMEDYIKERQALLEKQYIIYAKATMPEKKEILPLRQKEWGHFHIKDIFTLVAGKGKGLNHLTITQNGISYLGATNRNNGIVAFVEFNDKLVQKGNCIAFIRNGEGSMGYSVYKSENFVATSDITLGYNNKLNKYNGIFITSIADKVRGKYNFNYKRSDTRLGKEILQLPVDKNGNPDFKYMEQYTKNIIHDKITAYLRFKGNQFTHATH